MSVINEKNPVTRVLVTIILIFFVLATTCAVGYFALFYDTVKTENEFIYEVEVMTNTTDAFFLLVPFPINWDDHPSNQTLEGLCFIEGDGEFHVQETVYGTALNISASGPCKIRFETDEAIDGTLLSMKNDTREDSDDGWFWCYSSSADTITIDIEYRISSEISGIRHFYEKSTGGGKAGVLENCEISHGWQQIPIEHRYWDM